MTQQTPTDRFIDARGLRFHVREWRPSPATRLPVVLIHGLASSGAIWDLVAPDLAAAGSWVVALDQRGHGESDKPDKGYDFASIVADDEAMLDALDVGRAVIAGHSWGGSVALHLAAGQPERAAALVLVDGGFTQVKDRGWSHDEAIAALTPPRFAGTPTDDFLAMVRRGPLGAEWNDQLTGIMLRIVEERPDGTIAPRLSFEHHMAIVEALWNDETLALFARVACPTLLVAPEMDPASDLSVAKRAAVTRLTERYSAVRAVVVPDTIHDIPLQRPALLATLIGGMATTG